MTKKIILYASTVFFVLLNILLDININNYINIVNKCFDTNINLTHFYFACICFIIALISVLILLAIKLITSNKKEEIKGINLRSEDGTYGTANWLNDDEINNILGKDNTPGLILGKRNNEIIKLPFESYFNKNIAVFGSSGSMKTIRIFDNKSFGTFKI